MFPLTKTESQPAALDGAPSRGGSSGPATETAPARTVLSSSAALVADMVSKDAGRYKVLREHGRGGIGRVLAAVDLELDRTVAIKELQQLSHAAEARFVREARITARLEHPSIVPVHEAGRWPDGTPFYAMKLVSGRSLREAIVEAKTLDERLALIPNVLAVAEAVAYAHSERIIHRDLKPSNVILGAFGETIVIDWGLAKDLANETSEDLDGAPYRAALDGGVTSTGAILGTPGYMPPEQARGSTVDERADVYAIGAILFHTVAGTPPYSEETAEQVLRSLLAGPPAPLLARTPRVPADLAAIVETAMQRDPDRRYKSAKELAEDLRRFQTGKFVAARSYSRAEMTVRWLAQHRVLATASAAILATLAASYVRVMRERDDARQQRDVARLAQAETARERARASEAHRNAVAERNRLILLQAESQLAVDPTRSIAWLKHYPEDAPNQQTARNIAAEAAARGVAWRIFKAGQGIVVKVVASPDGESILAYTRDRRLRLWSMSTGEHIEFEEEIALRIGAMAISPDGQTVAVGDDTGQLILFDPRGNVLRRLQVHAGMFHDLSFSPDGTAILTAGADGNVALLPDLFGEPQILHSHTTSVGRARFLGDGRVVVLCGVDGRLATWSMETGRLKQRGDCNVFDEVGVSLAVSRTRNEYAIPSGAGRVLLYDVGRGAATALAEAHSSVSQIDFSPDGDLVAIASFDGTVQLVERRGRPTASWKHDGPAYVVAFSPTGQYVASAGEDGVVIVFDRASGTYRRLLGHGAAIWTLAFDQVGGRLITGSHNGEVRVWDLRRSPSQAILHRPQRILALAVDPSGSIIASDRSGAVSRIDGESELLMHVGDGVPRELGVTRDRIYALVDNGTLMTRASGQPEITRDSTGIVALSVLPGGRGLVLADRDGRLTLRAPPSESAEVARIERSAITALASSESTFVAGHADGTVSWAFPPSRLVQSTTRHHARIADVAISPDNWTASADWSGAVLLWTPSRVPQRICTHDGVARTVAFSADGELVASVGDDGQLCVVRVIDGSQVISDFRHGEAWDVAFAPDASFVAWVGQDAAVRVNWLDGAVSSLHGHTEYVTEVALGRDGTTILSGGIDGTVRSWSTASLREFAVPLDYGARSRWLDVHTNLVVETQVP